LFVSEWFGHVVCAVVSGHAEAAEVSGCVDEAVAMPFASFDVGVESGEFDCDHEEDGLFDCEVDAGHRLEDVSDFAVVVEWVAVGLLAWPVDKFVGFGEDF
jgi:hypothetical protein